MKRIFQYFMMCFWIIASEKSHCVGIIMQDESFKIDPSSTALWRKYRNTSDCRERKLALYFQDDIEVRIDIKAHHLAGNMKHIEKMVWNQNSESIKVPEYYKKIRSKELYTNNNFENGKTRKEDFEAMAKLLKRRQELFTEDINALREGGMANPNFINDKKRRMHSFYEEIKEADKRFQKYRTQRKLWLWGHPINRHEFEIINSTNIDSSNERSDNDIVIYNKKLMTRSKAREQVRR